MKRIRHTIDRERPIRITGDLDRPELFDEPVKLVSEERAAELVEHPLIEYADEELPTDYDELQRLAAAADTDEIDGNSSKAEIVAYLETLSADDYEALRE